MLNSKIVYALLLCLIFFLLIDPMMVEMKVLAFAPFILLCLIKTNLIISLWSAFFSGFLLDLLSSYHMGLFSITYVLTALILFRYRNAFSDTSPLNLGIFTAIFSFLNTLVFLLCYFTLEGANALSIKWVFYDLMLMPVLDALYSVFWIAFPLMFVEKWEKKLKILLLKKK